MSEPKATVLVHTSVGAVSCCEAHARHLTNMYDILMVRVVVSKAPEGSVCKNCVNEAKGPGEWK